MGEEEEEEEGTLKVLPVAFQEQNFFTNIQFRL